MRGIPTASPSRGCAGSASAPRARRSEAGRPAPALCPRGIPDHGFTVTTPPPGGNGTGATHEDHPAQALGVRHVTWTGTPTISI
jgi:hypothetical protein